MNDKPNETKREHFKPIASSCKKTLAPTRAEGFYDSVKAIGTNSSGVSTASSGGFIGQLETTDKAPGCPKTICRSEPTAPIKAPEARSKITVEGSTLWTVTDLGHFLQVSERSIWSRIRLSADAEGSIPHVRLGDGRCKTPRFLPWEIRRWLEMGCPPAAEFKRWIEVERKKRA